MIKTGSDFSGVGAFDQALERLGIKQNKIFACDMDKYARQTYIYNFGKPDYYPENVYNREIPKESLDIYMTSPPCQSFSLAGKRQGENSDKGVLFYNSHEFIVKNNPRYFIFENVKGLLSDSDGKTFAKWIDYLGGKSVNGNPVLFPHENSTPYHVYYQVMNAKHYGVPQNRERIFIIGIRDDSDNDFSFPKPFHLVKRLKDVLESEVDEKYFLSEKMLNYLVSKQEGRAKPFADGEETHSACITANYAKFPTDGQYLKIGTWRTHEDGRGFRATEDNNCPTIPARAREDGSGQPVIKLAPEVYQLNPSLESGGKQPYQQNRIYDIEGVSTTLCRDKSDILIIPAKQRIRRLTPKECFRLMDFNENFKWNVSDSQAYKQAGNSIVVSCLVQIIQKLKL